MGKGDVAKIMTCLGEAEKKGSENKEELSVRAHILAT